MVAALLTALGVALFCPLTWLEAGAVEAAEVAFSQVSFYLELLCVSCYTVNFGVFRFSVMVIVELAFTLGEARTHVAKTPNALRALLATVPPALVARLHMDLFFRMPGVSPYGGIGAVFEVILWSLLVLIGVVETVWLGADERAYVVRNVLRLLPIVSMWKFLATMMFLRFSGFGVAAWWPFLLLAATAPIAVAVLGGAMGPGRKLAASQHSFWHAIDTSVAERITPRSSPRDRSRISRLGNSRNDKLDLAKEAEGRCSELCEILRIAFNRDKVDQNADFFADLGGESLKAAQVVARCRARPTLAHLSVVDIYGRRTARKIALEVPSLDGMEDGDDLPLRPKCHVGELHGIEHIFEAVQLFSTVAHGLDLGGIAVFLVLWCPGITQVIRPWFWVLFLLIPLEIVVVGLIMPVVYAMISKWLFIGRYRPGFYPLYGRFHFYHFVVNGACEQAIMTVQTLLGAGSEADCIVMRWFGAKVGNYVHWGSVLHASGHDLLTIGNGASVGAYCMFECVKFVPGGIVVSGITIGNEATVGNRCGIGPGSIVEDGATLWDCSSLPPRGRVPAEEIWVGTPAQRCSPYDEVFHTVTNLHTYFKDSDYKRELSESELAEADCAGMDSSPLNVLGGSTALLELPLQGDGPRQAPRPWTPMQLMFSQIALGFIAFYVMMVAFPLTVVLFDYYYLKWNITRALVQLPSSPGRAYFIWVSVAMCTLITAPLVRGAMMQFIPKCTQGVKERFGPGYLLVWFRLTLSNSMMFYPWAMTMMSNVIYRMSGTNITLNAAKSKPGYWLGLPEMVVFEDEVFSGDGCLVGYPEVSRGHVLVGKSTVKRRCMMGNLAVMPPNYTLEEESLLGVGSTPIPLPEEDGSLVQRGTRQGFIGNPAMVMTNTSFANPWPYPTRDVIAFKWFIDLVTVAICDWLLVSPGLEPLLCLHALWWYWGGGLNPMALSTTVVFLPAFVSIAFLCTRVFFVTVVVSRLLPKDIREPSGGQAVEYPYWSKVAVLWDSSQMILDFFVFSHRGLMDTQWFHANFLRWQGARVGKNFVNVGCMAFVDPQFCDVGDDVVLGPGQFLLTHTVDKMVVRWDKIKMESGSGMAALGMILPSSKIGRQAQIGACSVVLKGQQLEPYTDNEGNPARPTKRYSADPMAEPSYSVLSQDGDDAYEALVGDAVPAHLLPASSLHEVFLRSVDRFPNNVCIEEELTLNVRGTPKGEKKSYIEIKMEAEALAIYLREFERGSALSTGGTSYPLGAMCFKGGSRWPYVCMIGMSGAGWAFVPLDPAWPLPHVAAIVEDSKPSLMLYTDDLVFEVEGPTPVEVSKIVAAVLKKGVLEPLTSRGPNDVCYIMYTSGTSGKPKGVEVENISIANLVIQEQLMYRLTETDRAMQAGSMAFDMCFEEIFFSLAAGGTLIAAPDGLLRSGPDVATWLKARRVTAMITVPTVLSSFSATGAADAASIPALPRLRLLCVTGEGCSQALCDAYSVNRRMGNLYGPTEATVSCTHKDLRKGDPVTIGQAIPSYGCEILTVPDEEADEPEQRTLVDSGPGELFVTGIGVARGYFKRPDLTADRFLELPGVPGGRGYLTGDLVEASPHGIKILGRIDAQVKIRGQRVELEGLEAVLSSAPFAGKGAAVLLEDGAVIAIVAGAAEPGSESSRLELHAKVREWMSGRVPPYCVPQRTLCPDSLPFTAAGKVDKKTLRQLAREDAANLAKAVGAQASETVATVAPSAASSVPKASPTGEAGPESAPLSVATPSVASSAPSAAASSRGKAAGPPAAGAAEPPLSGATDRPGLKSKREPSRPSRSRDGLSAPQGASRALIMHEGGSKQPSREAATPRSLRSGVAVELGPPAAAAQSSPTTPVASRDPSSRSHREAAPQADPADEADETSRLLESDVPEDEVALVAEQTAPAPAAGAQPEPAVPVEEDSEPVPATANAVPLVPATVKVQPLEALEPSAPKALEVEQALETPAPQALEVEQVAHSAERPP